jgi:hypothetical protein
VGRIVLCILAEELMADLCTFDNFKVDNYSSS